MCYTWHNKAVGLKNELCKCQKVMKNKTHVLNEGEMELDYLLMADCKITRDVQARLKSGSSFAQRMSDPNDDMIRSIYVNITAEFLTAY